MKLTPVVLVPALLLALTACGGSDDPSGSDAADDSVTAAGPVDAQTATVDMNDQLEFVPATVLAKVGSLTLEVDNVGKVPHNLVFDDEALGKTGTISGGEVEPLKLVLAKAGTFTFVCTFHSGMDGKVVVS